MDENIIVISVGFKYEVWIRRFKGRDINFIVKLVYMWIVLTSVLGWIVVVMILFNNS